MQWLSKYVTTLQWLQLFSLSLYIYTGIYIRYGAQKTLRHVRERSRVLRLVHIANSS